MLLWSSPPQGARATGDPPFTAVEGAFFALSVQDLDASARWYAEKFDLKAGAKSSFGDASSVLLSGHGLEIELLSFRNSVAQRNPFDPNEKERPRGIVKVGFRVRHLDATLAALRARGVDVMLGPFPPRRDQRANAVLRDNAGNLIQIFGDYAR
jgi:catechol 2,3-dioxygenase-like lactoylglutathione lyase family enzyme